MSTPTTENLFLQLWCTAANSDDAAVPPPGTSEFREHRAAVLRYWALTWLDCQDVAEHLAEVSAGRQQIRDALQVAKTEVAKIEESAPDAVHLTERAFQVLRDGVATGSIPRRLCDGAEQCDNGPEFYFTEEDALSLLREEAVTEPTCPRCRQAFLSVLEARQERQS